MLTVHKSFFEVSFSRYQFVRQNLKMKFQGYIAKEGSLPTLPESLPDNLLDLLKDCLKRDTTERPTAEELLKKPMFDGFEVPVVDPVDNSNWESLKTLM